MEPRLPSIVAEALAGFGTEVVAVEVKFDESLDRSWLSIDQLGRRLATTSLDWTAVDADPRAAELWSYRHLYQERLREVPKVMSHGDFSIGNLIDTADGVVAFDCATLGWEPAGFDLAHLALSAGVDPTPTYRASSGRLEADADAGFRCVLVLVGVSRLHWMLSRSRPAPPWYLDFLCEHQPARGGLS